MDDCKLCGSGKITGVEYYYSDPEHYDGISEWLCDKCGTRFGRWSGKVLGEGEVERRYGGIYDRKEEP